MEGLHERNNELIVLLPKTVVMKKIIVLGMFASMFVNFASCQNAGKKSDVIATVNVVEFEKTLGTPNVQLVDVRSPEEYAEGHLAHAVNIDVSSADFADKVAKLDKTKPAMVYCHSGRRSAKAANEMETLGFKKVYNLDGGISAWEDSGKPVAKGAQ
jgi:rhodanese-related sulfurtransferase